MLARFCCPSHCIIIDSVNYRLVYRRILLEIWLKILHSHNCLLFMYSTVFTPSNISFHLSSSLFSYLYDHSSTTHIFQVVLVTIRLRLRTEPVVIPFEICNHFSTSAQVAPETIRLRLRTEPVVIPFEIYNHFCTSA